MFLSAILTRDNITPTRIDAKSSVHLGEGPTITKIDLEVEADIPGLDDEAFQEYANRAKMNCPVSKALAAVSEITLNARLVK